MIRLAQIFPVDCAFTSSRPGRMNKDMNNVTDHLGTIINGQTFIYTGLGEFRTVDAALARTTEPRAIVFKQEQLVKHGVNYGCTGYAPVAQKIGV